MGPEADGLACPYNADFHFPFRSRYVNPRKCNDNSWIRLISTTLPTKYPGTDRCELCTGGNNSTIAPQAENFIHVDLFMLTLTAYRYPDISYR